MDSTLSDIDLAIAAAEAGAAVVRAHCGMPLARIEKSPRDFATETDLQAEQAILAVLRSARPLTASSVRSLGWHGLVRPGATGWSTRCAGRRITPHGHHWHP